MHASQKLLIIGGLELALWGMAYGLYYAVFVEHQSLDQMGSSLMQGFQRAAERKMPESKAALDAYAQARYIYVRQVDVHGHWIGLGMFLIMLGIAFDRLSFQERGRRWLATAMFLGSAIFPLGVLLETVNRGWGPKSIAGFGSALMIVALSGITLGFARGNV